jgi:hypothetical protein
MARILASILACQQPFLAAATVSDQVPEAKNLDATFLSLDAASSRVTYQDARTGEVKTISASWTSLEKLAGLHSGQKVVFSCQTAASGETLVWGVKKKANWWKRGAILLVVTAISIGVAGVALASDTPL